MCDLADIWIQAPLQINAMDHSPTNGQLVVGGPDGYCAILSAGPEGLGSGSGTGVVELKGHVGDVLDVKWFPSGEVSCSHTLHFKADKS